MYWWDNECHFNESPKSEYPDFEALSDMKNITLVKDFLSYTPNKQIDDKNIKKGIILKKGKLAKGYIEIKASINNKPLTTWESIYFKAPYNITDHNNNGGHIFKYDMLKTPPSDITHLLFSLNNIPLVSSPSYSESTKTYTLNLFDILNQNKEVSFLTFISSLNPAKINSIKIYYLCDSNVDNGQCELSIKN